MVRKYSQSSVNKSRPRAATTQQQVPRKSKKQFSTSHSFHFGETFADWLVDNDVIWPSCRRKIRYGQMTCDRFGVMSLAPRRKCPRNVVQMTEAMVALFRNDSVAISCHCKRSKIILVKVLTELCSLENIAS